MLKYNKTLKFYLKKYVFNILLMVLTELQKYEIVYKYTQLKKTMREISNDMSISLPTVNLWIKRYNNDNSLLRRKGSGMHKRTK